MMVDKSIFRAYDVRGVYGKHIDEEIFTQIGNAFGQVLKDDTRQSVSYDCVIGWDARSSSMNLAKAFADGLTGCGCNAIFVGQVPLAAACFAGLQSGSCTAYITASHLPKEWNGIKFFDERGIGFMQERNFQIRDIVLQNKYFSNTRGTTKNISSKTSIENYITHVLQKIKLTRKLKVVIDSGNGMAGLLAPELFRRAGFDVESIFEEPDGNFPNRKPDPLEDELLALKTKVKNADFGIAYDGDGDRMTFVSSDGRKLTADQISCIIIPELMKKHRSNSTVALNEAGENVHELHRSISVIATPVVVANEADSVIATPVVVANVECSRILDDVAKDFGVSVHRVPVGHTFMMQAVHEKNAIYGVESALHFSIPFIAPFDDAIAVSLYAACAMANSGKSLRQLIDAQSYYPFERVNFECDDNKKFDALNKIKSILKKKYEETNDIDGIRVDFDDGWILIRVSNTGPVIRLTIEANNDESLKRLKEEFTALIENEIYRA